MVVNTRPLKRMKTVGPYDFHTFPSSVVESDGGPFRTNVRAFLSKHAIPPPTSSLFPHMLTWQIVFRIGDASDGDASVPPIYLDIVEEDVASSRSVYCDQCRVVGWSGHPVCAKRYHFIIKADGNSIGGYHKPCMCCGDVLHLSESKCKSCNLATSTNDAEDWVYSQLENTTHLLHGVVHSNGYGHLLRVNGREGGSRVLSGCHIMDFWDRLCKILGVRKVSVMDVSKKYGLEYRLLHSITKGYSWYGDWGYEFGAGSFALTLDSYKTAVESLSSIPLSIFLNQGLKSRSRLQDTILYYQSLSEHELVNICDLFCFLLSLIRDKCKNTSSVDTTCKKRYACTSRISCPWNRNDVERAEEAMIRVLRAVFGANWVSLRALRGAVCKVAPPELLDYCLKELGGKMAADGMVVNARCNSDTGSFEYRLEPADVSAGKEFSEEKLLWDLVYLYESLLHPQTMVNYVPQVTRDVAISSAEKLLDCKQFVKDYKPEKVSTISNPSTIRLSCQVELKDESEEYATSPPTELIILPRNATILDLKIETSKAFQDVYLMFERFQAEEVVGYGSVEESTPVQHLLGTRELVRVRGRCPGKNELSRFRMERGVERWTVDCKCGAKDDDGERMLACDVCNVWQHTRCSGIKDSDAVPARFVCQRCRRPSLPVAKIGAPCRDKAVSNAGSSSYYFGRTLTTPDDT